MASRHSMDPGRDLEDAAGSQNVFSDNYAESFVSEDAYADSQEGMSIHRPDSIRSLTPPPQDSRNSRDYRLSLVSRQRDSYSGPQTSSGASHRPANSITKDTTTSPSPDSPRDPFADSRDGAPVLPPINTDFTGRNSGFATTAHRSLSTSSFAGSQSPGSIHEGPSHPYAMYPQNLAMSRTPSVATASTRPLSQVNPGSRGPAHPYDAFAQTVPAESAPVQGSIQVGFPGADNSYHRRLGPEGEEQDIIGADGHTEQLPPYSRYPEEVHLKTTPLNALPAIGESSPTTSAPPPGTSRTFVAPLSSRSSVNLMPAGQPTSGSGDDGTGYSEKRWQDRSWKERRKMKFCWIPLWVWLAIFIAVILTVAICMAIIGGVLGKFKSKHDHKMNNTETPAAVMTPTPTMTTSSTLIDAEPVTSTPAYLAPMPSGRYEVDTGNYSAHFAGCLPDQEQDAWSCDLKEDKLTIMVDSSGDIPLLSLMPVDRDIWYGVQPPTVNRVPLTLVHDTQTPGKPIAFQFQTLYNKRVILQAHQLNFNHTIYSRGLSPDYDAGPYHPNAPGPGMDGLPYGVQEKQIEEPDCPWFCEWPQTFLEIMIYVGHGSTINESSINNGSSSGTSGYSGSSTSTSSSSSMMSSKPTYNKFAPVSQPSSTTKSPSPTLERRTFVGPSQTQPDPTFPTFAQMVKIEERRLHSDKPPMPPTCTQMNNVGQNGTIDYEPLYVNHNQLRVFKLNETDPQIPLSAIYGQKRSVIEARGDDMSSGCYCAWNSPHGKYPPPKLSQQQYKEYKESQSQSKP